MYITSVRKFSVLSKNKDNLLPSIHSTMDDDSDVHMDTSKA